MEFRETLKAIDGLLVADAKRSSIQGYHVVNLLQCVAMSRRISSYAISRMREAQNELQVEDASQYLPGLDPDDDAGEVLPSGLTEGEEEALKWLVGGRASSAQQDGDGPRGTPDRELTEEEWDAYHEYVKQVKEEGLTEPLTAGEWLVDTGRAERPETEDDQGEDDQEPDRNPPPGQTDYDRCVAAWRAHLKQAADEGLTAVSWAQFWRDWHGVDDVPETPPEPTDE